MSWVAIPAISEGTEIYLSSVCPGTIAALFARLCEKRARKTIACLRKRNGSIAVVLEHRRHFASAKQFLRTWQIIVGRVCLGRRGSTGKNQRLWAVFQQTPSACM